MKSDRKRFGRIGLLISATLLVGCGGTLPGTPDLPAPEIATARAAMVATLNAWKAGRRQAGTIGSKPVVGIVDSLRAERPLLDYEVVGPLAVVDKARPFAVRLTLDAPLETVSARYFVLGQDPLWVFRQEDLEMMLHWEHKMPSVDESNDTSTQSPEKPRKLRANE